MNYNICNFILFQIGWFACVLGGAYQWPLLGVIYGLLFVILHLYVITHKGRELLFLIAMALVGYTLDSLFVKLGYFYYPTAMVTYLAPIWIGVLWMIFACTVGYSLAWLANHKLLATFLGGLFGPLAYYSAAKLGAVDLLQQGQGLYLQSIAWAVVMPSMFHFYQMVNAATLEQRSTT